LKIVLASRNKKKIEELRQLLSELLSNVEVLSLDDVGITGDIEEDGTTFEENALIKARVAAGSGYIGVADDSGLTVDALGGAPGIFSARYAGEHASDEENNRKLLDALKDTPDGERDAHYVAAVACVFPDGRSFVVQERCDGVMIRDARGENGFGYDPYFYIPEKGKTFAEMSAEDKHKMSHRGKAMRRFLKIFEYYREVSDVNE
jgi:XTP/dITP diphosphohydrolase